MEKRVHIFAVDDDDDDSYLLQEAFCHLDECPVLEIYRTGPALLNRLDGLSPGEYPDLILLDMNLPGLDGQSVLKQLKGTSTMCLIPVLTLTSSTNEKALLDMYRLGTSAVLRKSVHFDELVEIVRAIDQFWLRAAALPSALTPQAGNGFRTVA